MEKVIGVRFRSTGKLYYFSPGEFEISPGNHVIVETARGTEYGTVVFGPQEMTKGRATQNLKKVIRLATPEDDERAVKNREKEREALKTCHEKILHHKLDMKLIDAEYTFDNNKLMFYFTADGRVDFRDLVKDLAAVFRTRIELRQIGVRDETKILGGYGICGRELCCRSYLTDFAPVSIKMAKEQNLSLNPTKISGVCGRLMCCLKNEEETYEDLNTRLPKLGETVRMKDGKTGTVQTVNVLRETVRVLVEAEDDTKEIMEFPAAELSFKPRRRKPDTNKDSAKNGKGAVKSPEDEDVEITAQDGEEDV